MGDYAYYLVPYICEVIYIRLDLHDRTICHKKLIVWILIAYDSLCLKEHIYKWDHQNEQNVDYQMITCIIINVFLRIYETGIAKNAKKKAKMWTNMVKFKQIWSIISAHISAHFLWQQPDSITTHVVLSPGNRAS